VRDPLSLVVANCGDVMCVPLEITVTEGTLNVMMTRYSDREGNVRFDDFVACYIKLKSLQSMCQLLLFSLSRSSVVVQCCL